MNRCSENSRQINRNVFIRFRIDLAAIRRIECVEPFSHLLLSRCLLLSRPLQSVHRQTRRDTTVTTVGTVTIIATITAGGIGRTRRALSWSRHAMDGDTTIIAITGAHIAAITTAGKRLALAANWQERLSKRGAFLLWATTNAA